MRLATQLIGPNGSRWWVWEYDEARPRDLDAADLRARYAVKRLVGVFASLPEAEQQLAHPLEQGQNHE